MAGEMEPLQNISNDYSLMLYEQWLMNKIIPPLVSI